MINFIKYTKVYFIISIIFLSIGIFSMIKNGFIFGIDFTGGSIVEYKLTKNVNETNLKNKLKLSSIEIISINKTNDKIFSIRTSPINEDQEGELRKKIKDVFSTNVEILRFDSVGPALGRETVNKTFIASLVALAGILIYISFTFKKFSYGIAAVFATVHDFLILLGMYSLMTLFFSAEVDSLFITAVLTTMSFSVHDTIVVFDKIRDYKKTSALSIDILSNKALTETMVRSINNSLTIILMLIPLVVLGTESIRFFAAALLVGTITGTYSSPFIAVPLLVIFEKKK
ncbi:protein-export membrane protein SecF [Candidatus Roizmanbacteria bacterium RIFCSPHIGHO2_02_FULL_40_9]|uniref:Protein-export membrane protein SecF n=2 Tax=Candidatus Roizmaniibacteriota TaxID=1752723 RepID=A0A1F7ILR5_9BACT|nr:MAG: protein-export membrane protein SecF [Candidatus Roizmanbacteria bacterium RIFCSPHIGHO2_02_FULL_40_9]OGK44327.1 MAG: protein-export membrane protein SecF [Candidatus Roizmanbacteria bacterium RIFCSPLOWO2_01_FULL_38_11]